jgi:hypothetical protein
MLRVLALVMSQPHTAHGGAGRKVRKHRAERDVFLARRRVGPKTVDDVEVER